LDVNGEAIYGTRCWKKFGEGDAEQIKGSFTDNKATVYTAHDIRFTTKGRDFYAIALNWDDNSLLIRSLDKKAIADAEILNVTLLGSDEKITWQQTDEGLKLSFPKNKPCDYAYSFKITFSKKVGENLESEAVDEVMKHGG
jgi:alpha-L-fucosidase